LRISVSIDSKLTFPGIDLINARSDPGSSDSSPASSPRASSPQPTSASTRPTAAASRREGIAANQASSAVRRAEATILLTRPSAGGSIRSSRILLSSSTRTRSPSRSAWATFTASQLLSVGDRALPEVQVVAYLLAVVIERAA
jgi:hypothetical protein